jgi:uncharacterized protein (TIGR03546 family)
VLTMLAKLLKALNSEASPSQISLAFVLGMIMGLTPLWSAHNIIVMFLALVLRINLTGFFLAFGVFSGLAYLLDPAFIVVGERLLTDANLEATWKSLYVSDAWRVTHFNNTLTLGSLVVSLALAVPAFLIFNFLIRQYREKIFAWVQKTKFMHILKANSLYKIYSTLSTGGV